MSGEDVEGIENGSRDIVTSVLQLALCLHFCLPYLLTHLPPSLVHPVMPGTVREQLPPPPGKGLHQACFGVWTHLLGPLLEIMWCV